MGLKILNTGSYLPEKIVSNFDLEKIMDTSDEWIRQRTGISERRFSEKGEDTSSLALKAGEEAVEGYDKSKIAMVVVASFTPDYIMPNMASLVHSGLDLSASCMAIDINLACSGFTSALKIAEGYINEGDYALIIGAEVTSKHLNMDDRSTAVLFGDGAGALLVSKNDLDMYYNHGIVKDDDYLTMFAKNLAGRPNYIEMKGKDVYKFAVSYVPKTIEATLEKAGLRSNQIDYFILHQANGRIISQLAKKLSTSEDKFPINLDKYANTSAATIPLLLADMNNKNKLKENDKLLMASFGAGLQYSSLIIEW